MMINANELRLLNKVYGPQNCVLTVAEICASGITYDCVHTCAGHMEWNLIEPIPLDSGILERCGFVKPEGYTNDYRMKGFGTDLFSLEKAPEEGVYRVWYNSALCMFIKMDSLHQLQNLVFALTGTDLQITPQ